MDDKMGYYPIFREEQRGFYHDSKAPLIETGLDNIKSVNDQISLKDVQEIYAPLTHLIHLYVKEFKSLALSKGLFLHEYVSAPSFIIGIVDSVAVGKSTATRLLQRILTRTFKRRNVQLITTDGFLYPNKVLEEQGIMDQKRFPESYDTEGLINFLNEVKSGKDEIRVPVYSHSVYDVIEGEYELIQQPDILIVEGVNTLQLPANQQVYVSDSLDFSVFVDADPALIEKWYLERFGALLNMAFLDPNNYYYQYAVGKREDVLAMTRNVWKTANLPSLEEHILSTRGCADIILHRTEDRLIDQIYLRKY